MGVTMDRGPSTSDGELLARAREGDSEAFEALYLRHAPTVRRYALSLTRRADDADELVAEVFANLLSALRRGNGPTELVVPYVISCIKHTHWRAARERARGPGDDVWREDRPPVGEADQRDVAADIAEADVVASALRTLPPGTRELLWLAEVEEAPIGSIADRKGMTPHAVAASTHRARRALGSAYLAAHSEPPGGITHLDPACQDTLAHLASFVRGKAGARRRRRVERHLATCDQCARNRERLEQINSHLRHVPQLPFQLGIGAASVGVKSQLVAWLSASTAPLATSGAVAMAVVLPLAVPFTTGREPEPAVAAAESSPPRAPNEHGVGGLRLGRQTSGAPSAQDEQQLVVDRILQLWDAVRHGHAVEHTHGALDTSSTPPLERAVPDIALEGLTPATEAPNQSTAVGADGAVLEAAGGAEGTPAESDPSSEAPTGTSEDNTSGNAGPGPSGAPNAPDAGSAPAEHGSGNANGPSANSGQGNANGPSANSGQGNANGPSANSGQGNANGPTANNGQGNANGPTANSGQGNANGPTANNGQGNANGPTANNGQGNANGPTANNGQGNANGPTANNGQGNATRSPKTNGNEATVGAAPTEGAGDDGAGAVSPAVEPGT